MLESPPVDLDIFSVVPLSYIQTCRTNLVVHSNLNFDVSWVVDKFLDEESVVSEGRGGFLLGEVVALDGLLVVPGDAHPFAPATGRRFDHNRVPDLVRNFKRVVKARKSFIMMWFHFLQAHM